MQAADWGGALDQLAGLASVETGFWDITGTHRQASHEGLVAVLRALGHEIERPEQAPEALARARAARWRRVLEPCVACFAGEPAEVAVRLPDTGGGPAVVTIELESGETVRRDLDLDTLPVAERAEVDGRGWVERRLPLPGDLPPGYHQLRLEVAGAAATATVLSAPATAHAGPGQMRTWGLFAPVYALRSADQAGRRRPRRSRAPGRLDRPARRPAGGHAAAPGVLLRGAVSGQPLFAGHAAVLERALRRPQARGGRGAGAGWRDRRGRGRGLRRDRPAGLRGRGRGGRGPSRQLPLVDYRRAAALKRPLLERLSRASWAEPATRARLEQFTRDHARLDDYARFRATTEAMGRPWGEWPAAQQAGHLGDGDFDEQVRRLHVTAQYLLAAQLGRLKSSPELAGLYLDLPVGVDGRGYDLWRERDAFAGEISVGAPPDPLCQAGQNWALPPLHPVRQREDGYRYLRDCLRAHMQHAAMLRIDHVMGLHRLFWIPPGGSAVDGVYVRYPADELYALVCIESQREQCAVAGEDLGTVPDHVRPTMAARGLHRLFVAEFQWHWQDGRPALDQPAPGAVASIDTHDTPTFAGFARDRGLIADGGGEAGEGEGEGSATFALMKRWSEELAAGPADVALLTLEDLWLEREPQNVPGSSGDEVPNWRRRMRLDLDQVQADSRVEAVISAVASLRKTPAGGVG